MKTAIVAVGSKRQAKLDAVADALRALGPLLDPETRFDALGVDVPSGVGHTPSSRAELMAGARGRCQALLRLSGARTEPWRYFVGLEGGFDVVEEGGRRLVFLENWVCVCDAAGRQAYGHAGGVLVPERLAAEVLDRGTELADAIDAFAGGRGIRDAQGALGVLTRNLFTRRGAYRIAVIQAFAPFFHSSLYSAG